MLQVLENSLFCVVCISIFSGLCMSEKPMMLIATKAVVLSSQKVLLSWIGAQSNRRAEISLHIQHCSKSLCFQYNPLHSETADFYQLVKHTEQTTELPSVDKQYLSEFDVIILSKFPSSRFDVLWVIHMHTSLKNVKIPMQLKMHTHKWTILSSGYFAL